MNKNKSAADVQRQNSGKNGGKFTPGNEHRFQPGKSGNPAGRPKSAMLSDALRRKLLEQIPDAPERVLADVVADALIAKAITGDVSACREVFDRVEGKAVQTVVSNIGVTDWREVAANHGLELSDVLAEAERLIEESANGGSDDDNSTESS